MPEAALRKREDEAAAEEEAPTPEMASIRDGITAKHASLGSATLYDLLGIGESASDAEIKTAYYSMVKKYHPDKHHSPYLEDVRGLLEELFTKITKAYQTLSTPDERYLYDASLKSPGTQEAEPPPAVQKGGSLHQFVDPNSPEHTAAKLYVEGKRLYDNMSYFDAIQHLQEAVRLDPAKASYHRLLGQSLMKNPHWQKDAEEHFLTALELDELDTECRLALGDIYAQAGMESRAKQMYTEVLELDPDNQEASLRLQGKPRSRGESLRKVLRWTG
jgi:curved DNA-binding protein CbpA